MRRTRCPDEAHALDLVTDAMGAKTKAVLTAIADPSERLAPVERAVTAQPGR
jgi:hypothetical protein